MLFENPPVRDVIAVDSPWHVPLGEVSDSQCHQLAAHHCGANPQEYLSASKRRREEGREREREAGDREGEREGER